MWSPSTVPTLVVSKRLFLTSSKCQFVHPSPSGRSSPPRGCPPLMNLLGSSIIFDVAPENVNEHIHEAPSLLPFRPPSSLSAYLFAKSLRAPTRCSHAPCGGAWARNTFASLGSALSCVTKTPFGFLQLYWPPHAAPHQLHCFSSCFVDTHQMQSSIPRHARQCDQRPRTDRPPAPLHGCTPCSFTLVQGLSSLPFNISNRSSSFPPFIALGTHSACQMHTATLSKQGHVFFARRLPCPTFAQCQCLCRFVQAVPVHLPHLVFESSCTPTS